MKVTELEPLEMASSVLWSGEKPSPCTLISPLYSGESTSGRALPSLIWPSSEFVAGLMTETVLLF